MRREFAKPVKVAVLKRAMSNGVVYCEKCKLPARKWQIDHVRADGLLGEPVIENAMLICDACFKIKNAEDTKMIARAKRIEARNLGVTESRTPLPYGRKSKYKRKMNGQIVLRNK